jgi:hypothetical protein
MCLNGEDRAGCSAHDFFRDTAQEQPGYPRSPVRSEDDQVRTHGVGKFEDHCDRITFDLEVFNIDLRIGWAKLVQFFPKLVLVPALSAQGNFLTMEGGRRNHMQ